ncbi:MAG: LPS export ABC transporter ATP-binding protein [Deltaproteobacteria bacterium]|nr:LPS export ABC transporter ATP-binding protein [Deltaproteobacteria bacterium]
MLEIKGLTKKYGSRIVVKDVNLKINRGEIVGLLGPNGAGKTTTFYMIAGLISPDGGKIYFNEEDITHFPVHKRAHLGIVYLPQESSIFRGLTVEENIYAILELVYKDKKARSVILERLLEEFRIKHIRKNKAYVVSGGERRRVEVARALALDPKIILLDEPFTGIDPIVIDELRGMILNLKKKNIGIVVTDHNVRETLDITDMSYILYEGKVIREGKPQKLAGDQEIKELYFGRRFSLE